MKIRDRNFLSILFSIIIIYFIFIAVHCSPRKEVFKNALFIDPADIADTLLPVLLRDNNDKIADFEKLISESKQEEIDLNKYFDIIFRYRDSDILPVFYQIVNFKNVHPFFKILAIYSIGETGSKNDVQKLFELWPQEKNDLVKEYLASAIGKIADSSDIPALKQLTNGETNAYIRKTIEASIDRATGKRRIKVAYLPLFDTTQFIRIKTYPSETDQIEYSLIARKKLDTSISQYIPIAKEMIFPHMQYKMCHSIYNITKQPYNSFALPGVSHVGEDSGWLFEGMPVHSIMDGRVALFQHEESWGCLVCIESMLTDSSTVCTYYGHLSSNVDVYIGQFVKMGDKIGEIGPSFSFQNGGYRSHLHLGIEKASIENALIAGYNDNIKHWYNPIEFINSNGLINNSRNRIKRHAGG